MWKLHLLLSLLTLLLIVLAAAEAKKGNSKRKHSNEHSEDADDTLSQEEEEEYLYGDYDVHHHACKSCGPLQVRKKMWLEQIKQKILTATGLETPPNMTGVIISELPFIQEHIVELNTQADAPLMYKPDPPYTNDEPEVKTKRVFAPVHQAPEGLQAPPNTEIMYFNLSDSLRTLQVRKALLHLWLKPVFKEHHSKIPITVYKVLKPEYSEEYIRQKEISTVYETVYPHRGTWIKIDLCKLVRQWFENPDENQGVVVQATDTQIIQPSESRSYAPMLEIHTRESRRSRSKRMANRVCKDDSQDRYCCRYPLKVDFVRLGWDFIVAPKSYEANFCRGECPYLYAHKYVHTSMLQKINQNGTTGPCCGARQLSAVQMLYYDHNQNVKLDIIQDMIVDRCGCN